MNQTLETQLRPDETLVDGVKVFNYVPTSNAEETTIDGTPWPVIATGENSDGKQLAVIKNPVNDNKTVILREHLFAAERFKPSDASMEIGSVAVNHEGSYAQEPKESHTPSRIRIIHGAQTIDH